MTALARLLPAAVVLAAVDNRPLSAQIAPIVHVIAIEGMVDLGLAPFLSRTIRQAAQAGASAVLLDIDTFGGRVDAAVVMRDALLNGDMQPADELAETIVDADVEIPGVVEKGKLLTLTASEALEHKVAELTADTVEAALEAAGVSGRSHISVANSAADSVVGQRSLRALHRLDCRERTLPGAVPRGVPLLPGFRSRDVRLLDAVGLQNAAAGGFLPGGSDHHGGLQGWWIAPILASLTELPLFAGSVLLTAFNDNALITYLATLVPDLDGNLKLAVVGGAVTGGGLTVIANAPNPAGQALLERFFDGAISPLGLLAGALVPTAIAALVFGVL